MTEQQIFSLLAPILLIMAGVYSRQSNNLPIRKYWKLLLYGGVLLLTLRVVLIFLN